jgi:O-antigen ligase
MMLLLAFSLPFEAIRPVISSRWLAFTGLELLAVATLLLGGAFIFYSRLLNNRGVIRAGRPLRRSISDPALLLPVLFLLFALVSAVLAPNFGSESLKSSARIAAGLALYLLILALFSDRRRQRALVWAIILGAAASALLGLAEAAGWSPLARTVALFKIKPTEVAGLLRVSASFQYATIAAAYFEMVVPLAIAASAAAASRAAAAFALAISLLCSLVVVLSVTRAGVAVLILILLVLAALSWIRPACRALRRPALLNLAILLLVLALQLWLSPIVRTRYTTANSDDWYGAVYTAPAALTLDSGETASVDVTVRNDGRLPWSAGGAHPVALAHSWGDPQGGETYDLPVRETPLPHDVFPGQSVNLRVRISANLPAGDYLLRWDLLHKDVEWFRYRGVAEAQTLIHVLPSLESFTEPALVPLEETSDAGLPTLSRPSLWRAAFEMFKQRPLLGHGPGNFRLVHGRYLALPDWDTRVNANNLYLELLTGVGLVGLITFATLMAVVIFTPITPLRKPLSGPAAPWISGVVAALLAFLLHGLFDHSWVFSSPFAAARDQPKRL